MAALESGEPQVLEAIAEAHGAGLVMLRDGAVASANDRALALLRVTEIRALTERLGNAGLLTESPIPSGTADPRYLDVPATESAPSQKLRVDVYPLSEEGPSTALWIRPGTDPRDDREAGLAAHAENLGHLYSILAHDLHAYLNSMVLNLELLRRAIADFKPGDESLDRMGRYASLVAGEIPGLDRMLKAVVGQMRLTGASDGRFDFRMICDDLTVIFDSYARQRRIRIETALADVPMNVAGDRDAMHHAMTSLLLAAIDALPDGAEVLIRLHTERPRVLFTALATLPEGQLPGPFWSGDAKGRAVALARDVLERHAARLLISWEAPSSARLEIDLPLTPIAASM